MMDAIAMAAVWPITGHHGPATRAKRQQTGEHPAWREMDRRCPTSWPNCVQRPAGGQKLLELFAAHQGTCCQAGANFARKGLAICCSPIRSIGGARLRRGNQPGLCWARRGAVHGRGACRQAGRGPWAAPRP